MEILGKRAIPVRHAEWHCLWRDEKTGQACEKNGNLAQRGGVIYCRHVCYGHGRERDLSRDPDIFYLCSDHYRLFERTHGVDGEPDWLRRERLQADYQRRMAYATVPVEGATVRISYGGR